MERCETQNRFTVSLSTCHGELAEARDKDKRKIAIHRLCAYVYGLVTLIYKGDSMNIPELDPLWVSVFVTVVLVGITGYYVMETRKIRVGSVRPNFSLRTGSYPIGGGMHELYLRNTGGVARDVNVDIETANNENELFFVPSLDYSQEINLQVNFQQIRENNEFVKVKLKFKDGYCRNLSDSFSVDLEQLSEEKREIIFQSSPMERRLKEMADTLKKIEKKLGK